MPLAMHNTPVGRRYATQRTKANSVLAVPSNAASAYTIVSPINDAFHQLPSVHAESAQQAVHSKPGRGSFASLQSRRGGADSRYRGGRTGIFIPPSAEEIERYANRPLPPTPKSSASSFEVKEYTVPVVVAEWRNKPLPPSPDSVSSVERQAAKTTTKRHMETPFGATVVDDSRDGTGLRRCWPGRQAKRMLNWLRRRRI
ncbi:hypothetical protein BAUCODRAFT_151055 [Baudoinia panamericana UAMH 10762]|uniref:Uncharacterized protein n=1 Tax=Baudoinia panamericana (strain UAMH 10762) TaxID=717646 RepID=M2N136_BAUPA|nr:uncharacterized protein BAUCODRAFT_151055 [Baudoinia panamericana UAMH 10762]EMC92634.1 hypothetical protein BAUCODRAFT_151055 [Baudoinia panamericana UAMH 10762]